MENDACVAVVEIRVVAAGVSAAGTVAVAEIRVAAAGVSAAETVAAASGVSVVDLHGSRSEADLQVGHPK